MYICSANIKFFLAVSSPVPPFRTVKVRCFGASDTSGAMSVRRASRHHTRRASCGVTEKKASPRPMPHSTLLSI